MARQGKKQLSIYMPETLYNAMSLCGVILNKNATDIISAAVLDYCKKTALEREGGKVVYINNPQEKTTVTGAELEAEVMRLRMAFNKLEITEKLGGAYGIDTITAFLLERLITDGYKEKTLFKLHKETYTAAILEAVKAYYSELGTGESSDTSEE